MRSETEKDTIMSRLPNLKNSEDVFRRISVTEDHTIEERQEIKRLVDKSKEKNQHETNAVWKVRGDQKKRMALGEVHQAGTSIQRINKSYNVNNVNERNIFKDNGQLKPDSNLHGNT